MNTDQVRPPANYAWVPSEALLEFGRVLGRLMAAEEQRLLQAIAIEEERLGG